MTKVIYAIIVFLNAIDLKFLIWIMKQQFNVFIYLSKKEYYFKKADDNIKINRSETDWQNTMCIYITSNRYTLTLFVNIKIFTSNVWL